MNNNNLNYFFDKKKTKINCPNCNNEITINWIKDNIPYFGDVMYISSICDCGFKFNDTIMLSQKSPCLYSLNIKQKKDLNSRVIKSTSCTIEIPEFGIIIEPGPISSSYITNIEGLLKRIIDVVLYITNLERNDIEKYKKGMEIYNSLCKIKEDPKYSSKNITIILKDPFGNSKIINQNVKYSILTKKEVDCLKKGIIIIDNK